MEGQKITAVKDEAAFLDMRHEPLEEVLFGHGRTIGQSGRELGQISAGADILDADGGSDGLSGFGAPPRPSRRNEGFQRQEVIQHFRPLVGQSFSDGLEAFAEQLLLPAQLFPLGIQFLLRRSLRGLQLVLKGLVSGGLFRGDPFVLRPFLVFQSF